MIKLKDLINRAYINKSCNSFDYILKNEKNEEQFKAHFEKVLDTKEWNMQVVLPKTRDADSNVYNFRYLMPKNNIPLELIAATGLRFFQLYLKGEIEQKISYDFLLGEITSGM